MTKTEMKKNYEVIETDNCIEFIKNSDRATATFTQGRFISKIKELAKEYPDEVQIVAENPSSIMAHIPVKYISVRHPRRMSEEQVEAARERMKQYQENKKGSGA